MTIDQKISGDECKVRVEKPLSPEGPIRIIIEGEPKVMPKYCDTCRGMRNLYEAFPKYQGPPDLAGCHCP